MSRYTTLLLDADGTLLDFDRAQEEAVRTIYLKNGIEPTAFNMNTYFEINHTMWKQLERNEITKQELIRTRFQKAFDILGLQRNDGEAISKQFAEELGKGAYLIEGAMETIERLAKQYELVIITNGNAATQHQRLLASGLKRYMSHIFISDEMGCQKPMKAFFDQVLAVISEKEARRLLVVGDSLTSDILGANQAGLDCCWINPMGEKAEVPYSPTYIIPSINELFSILE